MLGRTGGERGCFFLLLRLAALQVDQLWKELLPLLEVKMAMPSFSRDFSSVLPYRFYIVLCIQTLQAELEQGLKSFPCE